MDLYDLNTFFRLSADLNYQLVAMTIDSKSLLSIILERRRLPKEKELILEATITYLLEIYQKRRRHLGAQASIHPLRATALLARAMPEPQFLDLMAELLHDRFEDFKPAENVSSLETPVDDKLRLILNKLTDQERWFLMERLYWLTKRPPEIYYQYIGRMLVESERTPETIRVKLADRLDNTLDMRMGLEEAFEEVHFFEEMFQMMYLPKYKGFRTEIPHAESPSMNGAQRLYQLFKNITLMSLIRQKKAACNDAIVNILFDNLVHASIKEAQRISLHIFAYHQTDIARLRELMIETMVYVQQGGIDAVTPPTVGQRLDGLLVSRFNDPDKRSRNKKLSELYIDKDLMVEASIAFMVIFYSFLNDPNYFVHGISESGIRPE